MDVKEDQKGFKSNRTFRFLVYADCVNVVKENKFYTVEHGRSLSD
jgi:hypothetical protein